MSKEDEVLLEISDRIATITLNAPGRMNTISGVMLDLLSKKLLEADSSINGTQVLIQGKEEDVEEDLSL